MFQKDSPTIVIMLLSMAKLQRGREPEGGLNKRWQTPEEVHVQTLETVAHLERDNRRPDKIILLYTDTLYLNAEGEAAKLFEKYQRIALEHRQKTQKLFSEKPTTSPVEEMLWGELVQAQKNYQQPRQKLIEHYRTHPAFREAVQKDNTKRKELEAIPFYSTSKDGNKGSRHVQKGSAPTPSDMFVLEELSLFDGLAKGMIASKKIDLNHNLVIAYPGQMLGSLKIAEKELRITKGHSLRAPETAHKTTWLDVSDPHQAQEETVYSHTPHETVLKKHLQNNLRELFRTSARVTATLLLPVASLFMLNKPEEKESVLIKQNDYQAQVIKTRPSGSTIAVTFSKDNKGEWIASEIGFDDSGLGRPILFREDVAYIQEAEKFLLKTPRPE